MVEAHGLNPLENPKEVVSQQLLGRSVKEKRAKNIQKEKKRKKNCALSSSQVGGRRP
jgi:hypothetical protein